MQILFKIFLLFIFTNPLLAIKYEDNLHELVNKLKKNIISLRNQERITIPYAKINFQGKNQPLQIIHKSIEILEKINKFREIQHFGKITIPIYPTREITQDDIYLMISRLNREVKFLIKNKENMLEMEVLSDKDANLYEILDSISLSIDPLIGARGFGPNEVYKQSVRIIKIINFLKKSQNIHKKAQKITINKTLHENHILYEARGLLKKISIAQKNLWITPVKVSKIKQKVITFTEVYSYQNDIIAQLQRIKNRLGFERYFKIEKIETSQYKTANDIIKNLNYAKQMMPLFTFDKKLIQYDKNSLEKKVNELYGFSEFLIKKLKFYKEVKGIKVQPNSTPKLFCNKNIYLYQKIVENIEKIQKIRVLEGMKISSIPITPISNISTNQLYELMLRVDNELNILLENYEILPINSWHTTINKRTYKNKTLSDVYSNLWIFSSHFNTILVDNYTPNELFVLSQKIHREVNLISKHLKIDNNSNLVKKSPNKYQLITIQTLFQKSLNLINSINEIEKRANITSIINIVPQISNITTDDVYHLLKISNAMLIEIKKHFGIYQYSKFHKTKTKKTLSDIYKSLDTSEKILLGIIEKKH